MRFKRINLAKSDCMTHYLKLSLSNVPVCLLIAARGIFQLSGGCHVTITGDRAANLDLYLALMAFSSDCSF
jgi:hypothetical protein